MEPDFSIFADDIELVMSQASCSRQGAVYHLKWLGDVAKAVTELLEPLDETGLDPRDVEFVMSQANCSRNVAISALKRNEGDMVNAVLELLG